MQNQGFENLPDRGVLTLRIPRLPLTPGKHLLKAIFANQESVTVGESDSEFAFEVQAGNFYERRSEGDFPAIHIPSSGASVYLDFEWSPDVERGEGDGS